jgi:hypothetical protein
VWLRFREGVALTNGRSVYLDKGAFALTSSVYTSGPSVVLFAGSIPFAKGDYTTCAINNGRGSGGTLSTFQTLLSQLFPNDVFGGGLLFPSAAIPSISDSLIG